MAPDVTPSYQERLFTEVRRRLNGLGYQGALLYEGYRFVDWFDTSHARRTIPLATFAQSPPSYSTACFGIIFGGQAEGPEALTPFRALGAPYLFVIGEDQVSQWIVGRDASRS